MLLRQPHHRLCDHFVNFASMIAHSMRCYSIRCPTMRARMMWITRMLAIVFVFAHRYWTLTFPWDDIWCPRGKAHDRQQDRQPMHYQRHTIRNLNSISCDNDTRAWCCLKTNRCASIAVLASVSVAVIVAAEVDSCPMSDGGNRSLSTSTSMPWILSRRPSYSCSVHIV